ncbi:aminotransferase class V-fold PLP-dependent enzyme [Candidatus Saccharibacteria bacterium]|nr:aminotransferase class V-fold PLP-dependent enzyme [Candidatus Saccharibacteria bacterium]
MGLFKKTELKNDFSYLGENDIYLDGACQSLRPEPVIETLEKYYKEHNSCGERVKYKWGRITDEKVNQAREKVLEYLKLKKKDYFVSFTLNTTYGLNLILSQFDAKKAKIKYIVTSDIEHNSPFLSSISFAKKHGLKRKVIERNSDGSLNLKDIPKNSLVVVNAASNIDGRTLKNIKEVIKHVHDNNGFIIIDAAQAMAHSKEILEKTDPDAICFSAHKMYAPSLGGIIMRKDFVKYIDTSFIGGGMVDDVDLETYLLSSDNPDHLYTKFESGLQAWGEIIALGTAIDWLEKMPKSKKQLLIENEEKIFNFFRENGVVGDIDRKKADRDNFNKKLHLLNHEPTSTMSFYVDGLDSHLLGGALAEEGIMTRTGYFCVHYYLDHKMHFPPLVRISLGYQTTSEQVDKLLKELEKVL